MSRNQRGEVSGTMNVTFIDSGTFSLRHLRYTDTLHYTFMLHQTGYYTSSHRSHLFQEALNDVLVQQYRHGP